MKQLRSKITCIAVVIFITAFAHVQTNTITSLSAKTDNPKDGSSVNNSVKCVNASMTEKEPVTALREAAEGGNAEAQFELGKRYMSGDGVATNAVEAVKWYRKAAEQGYAKAQLLLGWAYGRGYGVATNKQESVKWIRKAVEQRVSPTIATEYVDKERKRRESETRSRILAIIGSCCIFKFLWASAKKRKGIRSLARLSTFAYKKAEFPGKRVAGLHYTSVF